MGDVELDVRSTAISLSPQSRVILYFGCYEAFLLLANLNQLKMLWSWSCLPKTLTCRCCGPQSQGQIQWYLLCVWCLGLYLFYNADYISSVPSQEEEKKSWLPLWKPIIVKQWYLLKRLLFIVPAASTLCIVLTNDVGRLLSLHSPGLGVWEKEEEEEEKRREILSAQPTPPQPPHRHTHHHECCVFCVYFAWPL